MASAARRELLQASIHVVEGESLVVPLTIGGLPAEIEALGRRWQRKREFHLTAVAARVIEGIESAGPVWHRVIEVASGRRLGPVVATDEVRRVRNVKQPDLETLIVMATCGGLDELYADLARALHITLRPPPAHVTLYSTDPARAIGIVDEQELAGRAPPLSGREQDAVRRAMGCPEHGN